MPELRLDPIQRSWVIISSERARRPSDFQVTVTQSAPEFCPLCPGNEDKTPDEVLAVRDGYGAPNSPGWSVRVVPNKFPALRIEGELDRHAHGMYDTMNGVGAHEVVIETPLHDQHTGDQPTAHLARVLRAYRDRLRDLMQDRRFMYVVVFRNFGESAGATLTHPHSQIMAMPILPQLIETELKSAREHFLHKERCLFCDVIRYETEADVRIVQKNEEFVAFCPYASRSPFELFIAPLRHDHDYADSADVELDRLADILRDTVNRLKSALNNPPYNFVLHTSPNLAAISPTLGDPGLIRACFHWHIEIIPRLTKPAGFEWGTGFHINPTPPEQAAEYLRRLVV